MANPIVFAKGEKINLCVLDKERHMEKCLYWFNDPEINKYLLVGVCPISRSEEDNFFNQTPKDRERIVFAVETVDGKYLGNVGLHKIDYVSGTAEGGIVIGEKKEWGKGYGALAEKMLIEYAFSKLNLRKIYFAIFVNNKGSITVAKKNGAIQEGTLRKHIYRNGEYQDMILLAVFRNK